MPKPLLPLVALIAIGAAAAVCAILLITVVHAQQGTLTVTPGSGPVGTTVVLSGAGCNNPARDAVDLVFGGGPGEVTGTVGAGEIFNVPIDAGGHFRTTYTIPSEIHEIQGEGGGLVVPGVYRFFSKPAACFAAFTVTASGLPPGGSAPPGAASSGLPFWAIAGFGIAAVGAGAAIVRFSLRRRATRPRGP